MRGCSERESEIASEIWREKMNAERSRDIARRKKRGGIRNSEGKEIMKSGIREGEICREREREERNRKRREERVNGCEREKKKLRESEK